MTAATANTAYHIVMVGGAGCVIANRLSQDGTRRVLLLEGAGPTTGH
jgi:choline dehydrogenase